MDDPDVPTSRGAFRPSLDDLFATATPVGGAEDLSREGVFDDGEVDEFLADLRATARGGS